MTPLEETNRRVRVAAAARGWTLGELAAKAGIAHATLSRAIAGKTPWEPPMKAESPLFRVARALEVPIESLRQGGDSLPLVAPLQPSKVWRPGVITPAMRLPPNANGAPKDAVGS